MRADVREAAHCAGPGAGAEAAEERTATEVKALQSAERTVVGSEAQKETGVKTIATESRTDVEAHKAAEQEELRETEEPLGSSRVPGSCATSVVRVQAAPVVSSKTSLHLSA